jgi:Ni/Fe-hydrogenase subunit HybB-like protein
MRTKGQTAAPERPGGGSFLAFLRQEMRPKGRIWTPFNVITVAIMLATAVILFFRFTQGLGSVTNLSQEFPWGLWIGFDVMTGVAFAGGAYVLCFLVYILRLEKYHAIVRVTVLNGFLAYVFYASALLLDLGRPWKVVNPIIGNDFGLSSVLFLVAWHFMLYMMAELVEFSPAIAEWLGWQRIRRILAGLTVGTVILGVTLSTLHQSALGALYLMTEPKLHPLWYSEFIPILFFVSSIFAGLSLVIFEGSITHKVFHHRAGEELRRSHDGIVVSLARIAGATMFVYLAMEVIKVVHGQKWRYLQGGWGTWYLVEILGCVALPMVLLIAGSRRRDLLLIRIGAVLTLVGVVLNRLNISVIAFKWYEAVHYVPTWMEVVVTGGVISAELWVFRWVILRMPVLGPEPAWAEKARESASEAGPAAVPASGSARA